MNELDRVGRALAVAHGELSPTSADKTRLRARILAPSLEGPLPRADVALDPPTLDPPTRGPSTRVRWAALRASGRLGLTLGAALLGAGVAIGFWWGSEHAAQPTESSPEANAVRVAAGSAQEIEAGAAAQSASHAIDTSTDVQAGSGKEPSSAAPSAGGFASMPAERTRTIPRAVADRSRARARPPRDHSPVRETGTLPPSAGAPASDVVSDELALLRRVERAIRAGVPALALALLDELDQRVPETRLAEERLAARRLAECQAAVAGASERARRFLVERPSSVYGQRLRLACALDRGERAPADRDEE